MTKEEMKILKTLLNVGSVIIFMLMVILKKEIIRSITEKYRGKLNIKFCCILQPKSKNL